MHTLAWTCVALLASAVMPVAAREAPAAHCFDARAITEVQQSDATTLALRGEDGRRHMVTLGAACPGILEDRGAQILGWSGWICGAADEVVRSETRACPIARTSVIDARDYAALLKQAHNGMHTLDPVFVRAGRSRGFRGTPEYCVASSWLRSWHETSEGIFVEVSPRRSGGNRYYRIETSGNCGNQFNAETLSLVSAMGLGMVCGNAGDHIVFGRGSRDALPGGLLGSGLPRTMPSMEVRCEISQVYPVER